MNPATKKPWEGKTQQYLAWSAHMPATRTMFSPFSCPHCKFKADTAEEARAEAARLRDLTPSQLTAFKQAHKGHYPLRYKLIPLPHTSTLIDPLHFLLNTIMHHWTHGIARWIDSDDLAKYINNLLKTKCGVVIDLQKVSNGLHIDAARMPQLPGAQAMKVAEHFDLFLAAVIHWEGRNTKKGCVGLRQFKLAATSMDALRELWNEMAAPMLESAPGKPPTTAERDNKAQTIGLLAKVWRKAYRKAFLKTNFKPYTHMSHHLEACQQRVQYNLTKYGGQAQEHYGKVAKHIVRRMTNLQLGVRKRSGAFVKSYVQQTVEQLCWRKYLNQQIPVQPTDYARAKQRRKLDESEDFTTGPVDAIGKVEAWGGHHTPMSMSA